MLGLMMRMLRSWTIMRMGVWAWRRPMPMWWSRPLWRSVTVPPASMWSCRMRQGAGLVVGGELCFGQSHVDVGGHAAADAAVGSVVVVGFGEFVELGLQLGQGGGWALGSQPAFEGLLEAFDFAAGLGVAGPGVLVGDIEVPQ